MSEEMLSHLILSLCLAHLGPCDNITIDSNKQLRLTVPANSIVAATVKLQPMQTSSVCVCCFKDTLDSR